MNELIHHDVTVPNQVAYSNISYTVVFFVFSLVIYDLMIIIGIIEKYKQNCAILAANSQNGAKIDLKQEEVQKDESFLSQDVDQRSKKRRNRKASGQNYSGGSGSSNEQLSQISRKSEHNFRNSKTNQAEYVPAEQPIKPEDEIKMFQSYIEFVEMGIKKESMELRIASYYNIGGLLRLLCFEPFLITFQMFPRTQVFLVFCLQLVFYIITLRCLFKLNIFKNIIFKGNFFINETFLMLFMCLCIYLAFTDPRNMDANTFKNIQLYTIIVICCVALLNLIIMISGMIVQAKTMYQNFKKKKQEQKDREEEDQKKKALIDKENPNAVKKNQLDRVSEEEPRQQSQDDLGSPKKMRGKKRAKKEIMLRQNQDGQGSDSEENEKEVEVKANNKKFKRKNK